MHKYDDDQNMITRKREYEKRYAPTNSGFPNQLPNVQEEMGAEFAQGLPVMFPDRNESQSQTDVEHNNVNSGGHALGYVSIVFAIASWFIWPVIMGGTAAIMGYISYRQGSRALGGWSIAISLLAVVLNLIIAPLY